MIAQMIVSGTTILTKAFFSAYQQALRSKMIIRKKCFFFLINTQPTHCYCVIYSDAKAGGAPAAVANAAATKYKMRPDEALKILNIERDGLTKKILDEVCILFGFL